MQMKAENVETYFFSGFDSRCYANHRSSALQWNRRFGKFDKLLFFILFKIIFSSIDQCFSLFLKRKDFYTPKMIKKINDWFQR